MKKILDFSRRRVYINFESLEKTEKKKRSSAKASHERQEKRRQDKRRQEKRRQEKRKNLTFLSFACEGRDSERKD